MKNHIIIHLQHSKSLEAVPPIFTRKKMNLQKKKKKKKERNSTLCFSQQCTEFSGQSLPSNQTNQSSKKVTTKICLPAAQVIGTLQNLQWDLNNNFNELLAADHGLAREWETPRGYSLKGALILL